MWRMNSAGTMNESRESWRAVWHDHEKLRYVAIGVWNTLFAYAAFSSLYALLHRHWHYLVIGVAAHLVAVTNAFALQRRFVFRSVTPWWQAYLRFNLAQLLMLCWGLAGLAFFVEVLAWHPLISQLVVIVVSVVLGYLLSSKFAFRKQR